RALCSNPHSVKLLGLVIALFVINTGVSVRRVLIAIASSCPYQDILVIAYSRIQGLPAPG
ncbi:MAG: hypothetical protein ACKPKF_22265, partial [Microcystis panniformis]